MLLSWLSNTFGIDIFITTFTPVHTTRAAKLGIVSGTVVVGFFLLLPTSLVVAQLATRLIIRRGGFSLRHPVWPSIAAFLVGDFLLELCTWSSSAITNMEEETASEIWLVFTHAGLFVLVTLGTLFGQSFIPVVITGSISTGTYSRIIYCC